MTLSENLDWFSRGLDLHYNQLVPLSLEGRGNSYITTLLNKTLDWVLLGKGLSYNQLMFCHWDMGAYAKLQWKSYGWTWSMGGDDSKQQGSFKSSEYAGSQVCSKYTSYSFLISNVIIGYLIGFYFIKVDYLLNFL